MENMKKSSAEIFRAAFKDRLFAAVEAAVEAVNAPAGIDQLLPAGEERVALRADFNADILLGGAGMDHLAAGAGDGRIFISRMNTVFHL